MDAQFLEEVKRRKEQGLTGRKIAEELKVHPSRVQRALHKLKPPEQSKPPNESKALVLQELREIIREELAHAREEEKEDEAKADGRFPVIRKMGGGMEMIAPEALIRQYMGGTPEEEIELRAIMKFRACMLMVMDLVNIQKGSAEADAKRMEPILRLMKETREEQDAAAQRAKESNMEIAQAAAAEAAAGAAARAVRHIDEKFSELKPEKADIATVRDPMKGLMARTMETIMNQLTGMLTGSQVGPTPGLVDKRVEGGK